MIPRGRSVLGKFFAENIALFQLIYGANSDLSVSNLAPISDNSAGHMLKIIVVKKDTLQVVDDHIDCTVGGVPDPFIIGTPRYSDPYQHEGLLKIWQTGLAFLGDGIMDHLDPVLLHIAGQFLPCRQWLWDSRYNHFLFSLEDWGCRFFCWCCGSRAELLHVVLDCN